MPRHLIIEPDIQLGAQCEGLPKNHFHTKRGTTYWDLSNDPGDSYKVKSEGFPMISFFSSTIDSITGKKVEKAKFDTSNWKDATTSYTAMKLYMGLSRVKTANDILLTNMISPALFTNANFPCPSRFMQHLRKAGNQLRPGEHDDIDGMYAKIFILKDKTSGRNSCHKNYSSKHFNRKTSTNNQKDT